MRGRLIGVVCGKPGMPSVVHTPEGALLNVLDQCECSVSNHDKRDRSNIDRQRFVSFWSCLCFHCFRFLIHHLDEHVIHFVTGN